MNKAQQILEPLLNIENIDKVLSEDEHNMFMSAVYSASEDNAFVLVAGDRDKLISSLARIAVNNLKDQYTPLEICEKFLANVSQMSNENK